MESPLIPRRLDIIALPDNAPWDLSPLSGYPSTLSQVDYLPGSGKLWPSLPILGPFPTLGPTPTLDPPPTGPTSSALISAIRDGWPSPDTSGV